MPATEMPEVVVVRDYDGYFETLVRSWIERKALSGEPFRHKRIEVSAGPYRPSAVTAIELEDNGLHVDFYSALRVGFGSLSESEISRIIGRL